MPLEFKEVILLKYYCDLEITEISELLQIPTGTIKSRLYRAREKIKKSFVNLEYFQEEKRRG